MDQRNPADVTAYRRWYRIPQQQSDTQRDKVAWAVLGGQTPASIRGSNAPGSTCTAVSTDLHDNLETTLPDGTSFDKHLLTSAAAQGPAT